MAKLEVKIDTKLLNDLEKLDNGLYHIANQMVLAGAEKLYRNVVANLPPQLEKSNFRRCVIRSKAYKTPSNGRVNCKVFIIDGYFTNHLGERTTAPLVANLFEYGRHDGKYPRRPFFHRSIKKNEIIDAMYQAQVKASGGLMK